MRPVAVVVIAVFSPAAGRRDDLVTALRASIPAVHAERGCQLYAIHDAADGTVTMIERWASPEDLEAHARGAAVEALNAAVQDRIGRPTTVTTMTPIPAGTAEQGQV